MFIFKEENFMDLHEAISKSIATVMKGTYVYVKTDIMEKPDIHFMVSKDKDEITIITKKENIKNLILSFKKYIYWRKR